MENKPLHALLFKRWKNNDLDIQDTIFIDNLDNLYKLLDCSTIDIQVRYINGKAYDFIFDDEYLLNGKSEQPQNAVALGIDHTGNLQKKGDIVEVIYGRLIVCGLADTNGQETDLTKDDLISIYTAICYAQDNKDHKLKMLKYGFEE